MKNKVYIERFGKRLIAGDKKAINELIECYLNEYNAEIQRLHITTDAAADRLAARFNDKGNELVLRLNSSVGLNVIKKDWFINCYHILRNPLEFVPQGGVEDEV